MQVCEVRSHSDIFFRLLKMCIAYPRRRFRPLFQIVHPNEILIHGRAVYLFMLCVYIAAFCLRPQTRCTSPDPDEKEKNVLDLQVPQAGAEYQDHCPSPGHLGLVGVGCCGGGCCCPWLPRPPVLPETQFSPSRCPCASLPERPWSPVRPELLLWPLLPPSPRCM